jgi:hypothetical protein
MTGDDDDGQRVASRLDPLERLESVHAGHLDVEKHHVGRLPFGERDAFRSARRLQHVVALILEDHPHRPADLRLVVYNENACFHCEDMAGARSGTRTAVSRR